MPGQTDGATPAATVNAQLASPIKHDGDKSPFIRVSRGIFALKNSPAAAITHEPLSVSKQKKREIIVEINVKLSESIIHSFGMYWQRDLVVWRNDSKMYGKQQALSKPVDFGKQKGIYILYDHHTVVYVGTR